MAKEPSNPNAIAFVDGQNLFHAAKDAFGYRWPNYDPVALAKHVCEPQGWTLTQTRFYTGVPDQRDNAFWNGFWTNKLAELARRAFVFQRPLRYRNQTIVLPDKTTQTTLVGQEKGIDVRIALDLVSLARNRHYDVALVFSQDQDLSEAADEIRTIAAMQARWIKMACAFPSSPAAKNNRGVNNTDWIRIDKATYDACIDPHDYRPKRP